MDLFLIILIAIGLSMDSFAVSIATTPCLLKLKRLYEVLKFAFILAIIQGSFTIFGWLSGAYMEKYLNSYSHWIAFGILFIIGVKMIFDGFKPDKSVKHFNAKNIFIIIGLGVATSIDALFVGVSISLLNINIFLSALIISLVTFIFSVLGVKLGFFIKNKLFFSVELLGGIILIGIGVKILLENMV